MPAWQLRRPEEQQRARTSPAPADRACRSSCIPGSACASPGPRGWPAPRCRRRTCPSSRPRVNASDEVLTATITAVRPVCPGIGTASARALDRERRRSRGRVHGGDRRRLVRQHGCAHVGRHGEIAGPRARFEPRPLHLHLDLAERAVERRDWSRRSRACSGCDDPRRSARCPCPGRWCSGTGSPPVCRARIVSPASGLERSMVSLSSRPSVYLVFESRSTPSVVALVSCVSCSAPTAPAGCARAVRPHRARRWRRSGGWPCR